MRVGLLGRQDVNIESEYVEGIVLILDGLEAGVVLRRITGTAIAVSTLAAEVDVYSTFSEGRHGVSRCSGPGDMLRKVRRIGRTDGAVEEEW